MILCAAVRVAVRASCGTSSNCNALLFNCPASVHYLREFSTLISVDVASGPQSTLRGGIAHNVANPLGLVCRAGSEYNKTLSETKHVQVHILNCFILMSFNFFIKRSSN